MLYRYGATTASFIFDFYLELEEELSFFAYSEI